MVGEGRESETEDGRERELHLEPQSLADYSLTRDGKTRIHVPSSAVALRYAGASEP